MRIALKIKLAGVAAGLMLAGVASAAVVGYTLDVTTGYQGGCPALVVGTCGGPDTGFFEVTNNGTTTFNGTLGLTALAGNSNNFSSLSPVLTLAPGQFAFLSDLSGESSNQGGYNGPSNSVPQPGAQLHIIGTMNGIEAISLSVFDSDIHSGVFATNPFGVSLDNYVFQGGDPLGRDTGDGFEEAQAPGHFQFFEAATTVPAPEPASLALLGLGLAGLGFSRRKQA